MRINEILVESTLQEGPLGSLVKAAGRGVGNVIGGVAGAAGAAKGAVKGAVARAKSSFKAGEKGAYDALAGKQDTGTATTAQPSTTPTSATATPSTSAADTDTTAAAGQQTAQKPGLMKKIGQAVGDFKQGFQQGSGQPSQSQTPDQTKPNTAKPAATATTGAVDTAQTTPTDTQTTAADTATDAKADTAYAKAKKAADSLGPEHKKEIVAAIQADPKVKNKLSQPKVTPDATQQAQDKTSAQPIVKPRTKKAVNITGQKQKTTDQTAQKINADKEITGTMIAEGFSIFRKHQ